MRRYGLSPSPSMRQRGPFSPSPGTTPVMMVSLPLRRPSEASVPTPWRRVTSIRSSGMIPSLLSRRPELRRELVEHVLGHRFDVIARLPPPFGAGGAVVHPTRPGIRDRLAHRIDLIIDDEIRNMLANLR